jgi:hypothetical protein
MQLNGRWLVAVGLSAGLLGPGAVLAQTPPTSAVIGNELISLGVSNDAGLAMSGVGLQFAPTHAEGLASLCACNNWSITLGAAPLAQSVEQFSATDLAAVSSVLVSDAASGSTLRVTHDFHPALGAPNQYEVLVTIENLGSTTVQPGYARTLGWANGLATPGLGFDPSIATVETTPDGQALRLEVGVASIEPGASQAFRLYFGAGASADEENAGLSVNNASVVSQTNVGTTGFVFAYAQGYSSVTAGSDGSGPGGGSGGGGGGGHGSSGGGRGGRPTYSVNGTVPGVHAVLTLPNSNSQGLDTGVGRGGAGQVGNDGQSQSGASGDNHDSDSSGTGPAGQTGPLGGSDPIFTAANRQSDGPLLAATPELDSLALMGTGLVGLGGYALLRLRGRQQDRSKNGRERLDAEDKHQEP